MLLSYGRYWNKSLYHQRSPRWRSAKLKPRKNLLSLLSSRIQIFGNLKDSQDDKKVKIFTTSCISDLCQSQMREVGTYWGWINRNWGWDARRRCWIGPRGWGCRPPPPRSSGHIDNWGTHTTGRRVQIQMCRYWLSNVVGTVNVVVLAHEKRHLRLRATSLLWVRENHLGQCFFANNTQEDALKWLLYYNVLWVLSHPSLLYLFPRFHSAPQSFRQLWNLQLSPRGDGFFGPENGRNIQRAMDLVTVKLFRASCSDYGCTYRGFFASSVRIWIWPTILSRSVRVVNKTYLGPSSVCIGDRTYHLSQMKKKR